MQGSRWAPRQNFLDAVIPQVSSVCRVRTGGSVGILEAVHYEDHV